jgi:hypothetical protein
MANHDQPHHSMLRKAHRALRAALLAGACLPALPAVAADYGGVIEGTVDSDGCPILWVRLPFFGWTPLKGDQYVDTKVEQPTLPSAEVFAQTGKYVWIRKGGHLGKDMDVVR